MHTVRLPTHYKHDILMIKKKGLDASNYNCVSYVNIGHSDQGVNS